MRLQQVVHEHGAQPVSLAGQTVAEHGLYPFVGRPFHLVHVLKENVDELDAEVAVLPA